MILWDPLYDQGTIKVYCIISTSLTQMYVIKSVYGLHMFIGQLPNIFDVNIFLQPSASNPSDPLFVLTTGHLTISSSTSLNMGEWIIGRSPFIHDNFSVCWLCLKRMCHDWMVEYCWPNNLKFNAPSHFCLPWTLQICVKLQQDHLNFYLMRIVSVLF